MSIVQPGGSDAPEIPDGLYKAKVKAVQDVTLEKPDNFGNTEKVKITVAFVDTDGVSQTLDPQVNRKWGEKANLFLIATACGCDCDPDEAFDTQDMLNRDVNILVETPEEGKWPRVKTWTRIKTARGAAQPPSTPAIPAPVGKRPGPIIDPDGAVNWDAFWKETERLGATKESVIKAWSGEDALTSATPIDIANWLHDWADRLQPV